MRRLKDEVETTDPTLVEAVRLLGAIPPLERSDVRRRRVRNAIARRERRAKPEGVNWRVAIGAVLAIGSVAFAGVSIQRRWSESARRVEIPSVIPSREITKHARPHASMATAPVAAPIAPEVVLPSTPGVVPTVVPVVVKAPAAVVLPAPVAPRAIAVAAIAPKASIALPTPIALSAPAAPPARPAQPPSLASPSLHRAPPAVAIDRAPLGDGESLAGSATPTVVAPVKAVAKENGAEATGASESELFTRAYTAERVEGNPFLASTLFDQYLRKYPDGPFAEEALGLAIEAAYKTENGLAANLGARYLRRYPKGRYVEAAKSVLNKTSK